MPDDQKISDSDSSDSDSDSNDVRPSAKASKSSSGELDSAASIPTPRGDLEEPGNSADDSSSDSGKGVNDLRSTAKAATSSQLGGVESASSAPTHNANVDGTRPPGSSSMSLITQFARLPSRSKIP